MSDPMPFKTVARHNRPGDAWIVINENVYQLFAGSDQVNQL
jgi:cytochrome b involved in lipid metabolism